KPVASINPDNQVFSGDTVTLRCEIQDESVSRWQYSWYKDASLSPVSSVQMYRISSVEVTHTGKYTCKGRESGGSRSSHLSDAVTLTVSAKPKLTIRVNPQSSISTGDTITLSCELQETTAWEFLYYYSNQQIQRTPADSFKVTVNNAGETVFWCCARTRNYFYYYTEYSKAVNITVKERPSVLSVSPQNWLTEGDSVTLSCEVTDSSTDWTFSWYTVVPYRDGVTQIKNTDYVMYHTHLYPYCITICTYIYLCFFCVEGESPPVSLIISPSRTQHFTRDSLSLSCEDQSNSTGWTVRRYTDSEGVLDCSQWGSVTVSTCKFSLLYTFYTGVYWCESESGENSNPVNITVHGESSCSVFTSSVHPVTEGHPLTLHCLYRNTNPSNLRADFYKDGSVVQNQTTGEMIIHKVSKSDEGFYHCKHPERGESQRSWISVR
ncbi:Fc receptor-like protein 5, partial [Silurus meridionalis]